ncbi:hypothetical protein TWF102_005223 [Orbilia oligospora]|uniref:Uncharacterized protein n=1 Tax=Orbilia oligospora TaxID=2813651 RepID=A0A7C8N5K1_ORBOL|nr:hypothetical protein TWF102_005223 [Orbilia oligospora]KAF3101802.1 hypothetical protein TWF103_007798 [Orbilia oligospora]KAF3111773.1 hypothetical protein TWF706_011502 [Orbilia oligospora]KAF3133586.1 hypothetical protein TWF703_006643 [Orbilia oligospora]KAF3140116.1 hypothetical protein TWF594_006503 [Orbilia oligospora]
MVTRSSYYKDRLLRTAYRAPFSRSNIKALPPDHFLNEATSRPVLETLVQKIDELGLKITSVDPVTMDDLPTLRITSRQTKPEDFDSRIASNIRLIFKTRQFYSIKFSEDENKTSQVHPLSPRNYGPLRLPGQSVGIEGVPWGGGTIGGYIAFDDLGMENYRFDLIEEATAEIAAFRAEGTSTRNSSEELSRSPSKTLAAKSRERETAEHLKLLRKHDGTFGKVSVTSGYRVDPSTGFSIDWGLVRMPTMALAANVYMFPLAGWGGQTQKAILTVEDPIPGEEVCKLGRSTNFTSGIVSPALHAIDLGRNGVITTEWAIIGDRNLPFSADGDSGSWVINKEYEVVGMIVGNNGVVSYMTPIKVVIKDIEAATGKAVILHGNQGQTWSKAKEWKPRRFFGLLQANSR